MTFLYVHKFVSILILTRYKTDNQEVEILLDGHGFCCFLLYSAVSTDLPSYLLLSKIDLAGLTLLILLILTSQGRSLTVSLGMRGSTIW